MSNDLSQSILVAGNGSKFTAGAAADGYAGAAKSTCDCLIVLGGEQMRQLLSPAWAADAI
jgi:hypothetical protein